MQRSSRDPNELGAALARWLKHALRADDTPQVSGLGGTTATGMSSETLLFDATWTTNGDTQNGKFVARIAPDPTDVPVFPSYDMDGQARTIQLVGELTDVPVPKIVGSEPDASLIGAPFFVMEHVSGAVPPDVMPYTFGDNWLYDADPSLQRRLQDTTLDAIIKLHAIDDAADRFGFLAYDTPGDTPMRRHREHIRAWYEFASKDTGRAPIIDRAFNWLDANIPDDAGDAVLNWGDARIGNVLYQDFRPVAILDWEMAALGPRALDVAWLVFAHEVFEHLAGKFGAPGMPQFLREADVTKAYRDATGHDLGDLTFYRTYSAVEWAIVFLRTGYRSVHFGERDAPSDPEEFLHHRDLLEQMLS